MNIKVFSEISELEKLPFKGKGEKFNSIFKTILVKQLSEEEYRLNGSVGIGNESKIWWFGIFDRKYYKDFLNVSNEKSISASRGFYIVYLFDEQKTHVYLTLAQASSGINESKNSVKKTMMIHQNAILFEKLFSDAPYQRGLSSKLSSNNIRLARDYEVSVILSKEYSIDQTIDEFEFYQDLNTFISYYKVLIAQIRNESIFTFKGNIVDLNSSKVIKSLNKGIDYLEVTEEKKLEDEVIKATPLVNKTIIETLNNRSPKPVVGSQNKRYETDPRLGKTTLVENNYSCECKDIEQLLNHSTFITINKSPYAEAHHLIPMKFQKEYPDYNLDRSENLVCLCPICHNAVHYGEDSERIPRLRILFEKSKMHEFLNSIGVTEFIDFYNKFY